MEKKKQAAHPRGLLGEGLALPLLGNPPRTGFCYNGCRQFETHPDVKQN